MAKRMIATELNAFLQDWMEHAHRELAQDSNLERSAELNTLMTRIEEFRLYELQPYRKTHEPVS